MEFKKCHISRTLWPPRSVAKNPTGIQTPSWRCPPRHRWPHWTRRAVALPERRRQHRPQTRQPLRARPESAEQLNQLSPVLFVSRMHAHCNAPPLPAPPTSRTSFNPSVTSRVFTVYVQRIMRLCGTDPFTFNALCDYAGLTRLRKKPSRGKGHLHSS